MKNTPVRRTILILGVMLPAGLPLQAQANRRLELFAGLSLIGSNLPFQGRQLLSGWQTSLSLGLNRRFRLSTDVAAQYRTWNGARAWQYQALIGPTFTARKRKVTGFVHALVGAAWAEGPDYNKSVEALRPGTPGFATAWGGGIDRDVGRRMAIRIFQVDYIANQGAGQVGRWSQDVRLGIGAVIEFGQRWPG